MAQSLSADDVSVSFEGLIALSHVTLDVPRERVTGLIGPNGAGKTTLVKVLTGFQKPSEGSVTMDGETITGMPPNKVRQRGIARTFHSGRLLSDLSVLDNLEVTGVGLGLSRREAANKAEAMLDWIGIPHLPERMAGGRALRRAAADAGDRPRADGGPKADRHRRAIAGPGAKVIDDVSATLIRLWDRRGLTLLVVGQSATRAGLTGGRMVLMRSGEVALEGDAGELVQGDALRQAYFGYGYH